MVMALFLLIGSTAFAAEEQAPNWEISMQPKPTVEEIEQNSRARSAKMRVGIKL